MNWPHVPAFDTQPSQCALLQNDSRHGIPAKQRCVLQRTKNGRMTYISVIMQQMN
jgi:hypothetical protein